MPKNQKPDDESSPELAASELARIADILEELVKSNRRVEDLLRISVQPILQRALSGVFKNNKQIRAYELSDGERSTRQIAEIVGVDQKTISTWWRTWEKMGMTEKHGIRGQFRVRYSLAELLVRHSSEETPAFATPSHSANDELQTTE